MASFLSLRLACPFQLKSPLASLCSFTYAGFTIAFTLWTLVHKIYPPPGIGEVDEFDTFGTFGEAETDSRHTEQDDEESKKVVGDIEQSVVELGK